MILFVCRARKDVGNGTRKDRSDDAEHDHPENRYVHVHHRFRDPHPNLTQRRDCGCCFCRFWGS
jgi:hypothetical protein